jgi:hypothetical protein
MGEKGHHAPSSVLQGPPADTPTYEYLAKKNDNPWMSHSYQYREVVHEPIHTC